MGYDIIEIPQPSEVESSIIIDPRDDNLWTIIKQGDLFNLVRYSFDVNAPTTVGSGFKLSREGKIEWLIGDENYIYACYSVEAQERRFYCGKISKSGGSFRELGQLTLGGKTPERSHIRKWGNNKLFMIFRDSKNDKQVHLYVFEGSSLEELVDANKWSPIAEPLFNDEKIAGDCASVTYPAFGPVIDGRMLLAAYNTCYKTLSTSNTIMFAVAYLDPSKEKLYNVRREPIEFPLTTISKPVSLEVLIPEGLADKFINQYISVFSSSFMPAFYKDYMLTSVTVKGEDETRSLMTVFDTKTSKGKVVTIFQENLTVEAIGQVDNKLVYRVLENDGYTYHFVAPLDYSNMMNPKNYVTTQVYRAKISSTTSGNGWPMINTDLIYAPPKSIVPLQGSNAFLVSRNSFDVERKKPLLLKVYPRGSEVEMLVEFWKKPRGAIIEVVNDKGDVEFSQPVEVVSRTMIYEIKNLRKGIKRVKIKPVF